MIFVRRIFLRTTRNLFSFGAFHPTVQKFSGLQNLPGDYFRLPYGYRLLFARGLRIKIKQFQPHCRALLSFP